MPHAIFLIIDAFYYHRGDGMMLFRDPLKQQNLLWFPIQYETIATYTIGVNLLLEHGWQIKGITVDGRRGVMQALASYAPVQHCHFHQLATINRYLTRRPKLEAAIALRRIALLLTYINQSQLTVLLETWHVRYGDLLKERTYHPSGRWSYTHRQLRSAYFSLKHNLPYLFTYLQHSNMPNTTNSLDGSITTLKTLLRLHKGMNLSLRHKVTEEVLRGLPTKKFH